MLSKDTIEKLAAGCHQAYMVVYTYYQQRIMQYCRRLSMDAYTTQEVTQKIFVWLWENRGYLPKIENIDGYLTTMAHHMTTEAKISIDRRKRYETDAFGYLYNTLAEPGTTIDLKKAIHRGVINLPPAARRIFVLYQFHNFSAHQLADKLCLKKTTVDNVLCTARVRFIQGMGAEYTHIEFRKNVVDSDNFWKGVKIGAQKRKEIWRLKKQQLIET